MRKDFDIVGSYDNQRISTFNAERTVNLFEYIDPNGKRPKVLFPTSGIIDSGASFNDADDNAESRATFVYSNSVSGLTEMYQVFGDKVYRITGTADALSVSTIGTLNTSTGYVGIDANSYQIIFVDGEDGWIWDINATTFVEITDTGFPTKPVDVCFLDGFFLVANGQTNNFQLCEINQGMVWSGGTATFTGDAATDQLTLSTTTANFATGEPVTVSSTGALPAGLVASTTYYVIRVDPVSTPTGKIKLATSYANAIAGTAIDITTNGTPTCTVTISGQIQLGSITSHPGTIVACRTLHRRIFLFSQNYTEVWENAGIGTNLPFRRNNSLLMEVGTPSLGSIAVGFDRMFFLSQDKDGLGAVMEVKGTESIPVSNRALDYQLAQYIADSDVGVADARGIMIKENGIIFYRLNFTNANHTFVLNVSMSTADALKWHEEEILNGDRHPAQTHGFFSGVNFYGSYNEPLLYIVDSTLNSNDGETIRRMRISKQFTPEGYNRTRIDRFQLDLLQGQEFIPDFLESVLQTESELNITTESGYYIITDQQIDFSQGGQPTVFLQVSRDGGQTWGNYIQANMGKIGERTFRTVWRKLGTIQRGQGTTFKIEFFNEIPFIVLGAAWDFEVMPE